MEGKTEYTTIVRHVDSRPRLLHRADPYPTPQQRQKRREENFNVTHSEFSQVRQDCQHETLKVKSVLYLNIKIFNFFFAYNMGM